MQVKPLTDTFAKAVATSRVDHYAIDMGSGTTLSVYNVYGWTGATQNKRRATRTNRLFEAIIDEVYKQPEGPTIIVGDFNGEAEDFKALNDLLTYQSRTDVGADAHIFGKPRSEGTCLGPNASQPTRRDYVIANAQTLQLMDDFQVLPQQLFPVHSFLRTSDLGVQGGEHYSSGKGEAG